MIARTLTLLAAAALAACSINVQDDRRHDDATRCSVECPDRQDASVTCAAGQVPTCVCEPAPAASCEAPRARAR